MPHGAVTAVNDCRVLAEHAKPRTPAPNSELLQFMEREVPPEIRRYVTDEAKLADAEAELKKIWNRPRPVTDGQPDTAAVQLVRLRVCVMTAVPLGT